MQQTDYSYATRTMDTTDIANINLNTVDFGIQHYKKLDCLMSRYENIMGVYKKGN